MLKRVSFRGRDIIHGSVAGVGFPTTELFLRQILEGGLLDDRGTSGEKLSVEILRQHRCRMIGHNIDTHLTIALDHDTASKMLASARQ